MGLMSCCQEARYFIQPGTLYRVEFPPGPLAVGEEPVKKIDKIQFPTGILRVISPTDCVKDRLAAYYHWGDRQGLAQAIMVAPIKGDTCFWDTLLLDCAIYRAVIGRLPAVQKSITA